MCVCACMRGCMFSYLAHLHYPISFWNVQAPDTIKRVPCMKWLWNKKTDIRFGIARKLNGRLCQKVLSHYFLLSDTISTTKKTQRSLTSMMLLTKKLRCLRVLNESGMSHMHVSSVPKRDSGPPSSHTLHTVSLHMPCVVSAEDKMQYYSFVCKLYVANFFHKETEVQAGIFSSKDTTPGRKSSSLCYSIHCHEFLATVKDQCVDN